MELRLGKETKNFTQIIKSDDGSRIVLDAILCKVPYGPEYYKKKRIINFELEPDVIKILRCIESKVNEIFHHKDIQSSFRGNLLRTYFTKKSVIVDQTHMCRTFAEIEKDSELLVNLEYQGIWNFKETYGHFWAINKLYFLDIKN